MSKSEHYEAGRQAHHEYYNSQAYSGLSRGISASDAIKLFFPNVEESMMQVSSPLPKKRREWIKGWEDVEQEAGL